MIMMNKGRKRMDKYKPRKKFCWNERGALEGLPLYLIILMVITALAIVIMVTWLGTMQKPDLDHIEISGTESDDTLIEGNTYDITITAKGTNGKGLEGVSIKLDGAEISKTLKTQADGSVTFENITPDISSDTPTGEITVTATYTGNILVTKTTSITVKAP